MSSDEQPVPPAEHAFAPYVRILGKGKTGSRSLSREQARQAFTMILRDEVEQVQLMLLRVKEESPEELAGFVDACRAHMLAPPEHLAADLDWSSYAGKKHQHPWYILAMLLLAGSGYRVVVHGAAGHTPGRLYTETAFQELGLPVAQGWTDVEAQLAQGNLSYLPLARFCPELDAMLHLKPLLGLRSPVNTLTRLLNPLRAHASLQSIFHPAYARLHREADILLSQTAALVLKGCSGEVEVKPQADTRLHLLRRGNLDDFVVPRHSAGRVAPVEVPASAPLRALWRGDSEDAFGEAATLATTGAALLLLNPDWDWAEASAQAAQLWAARDRARLA